MNVTAAEPIMLGAPAGATADWAWSLSCSRAGQCSALATLVKDNSAALYEASFDGSSRVSSAAATKLALPDRLSVLARVPIGRSDDKIADLAAAVVGGRRMVAWVSDFDPALPYSIPARPAPDGKRAPVRALLDVAALGSNAPSSPATRVSWRARSVGGVDLAAGQNSALLIWSAIDNRRPEVFVTLLDSEGKKKQQRSLTNQRSEIYDVAAVSVDHGWVVAWIDARHGNPEVYSARLSERLGLLGPPKRITKAEGVASGLALVRLGANVLAVWADDRTDPVVGKASIYGVVLQGSSAEPLKPERRLFESAGHSESARAVSVDDGAIVAWREQTDGGVSALVTGRIGLDGAWVSPPKETFDLSHVIDFDIEADGQFGLLGAIARQGDEALEIELVRIARDGSVVARRTAFSNVGTTTGPAHVALADGKVYFTEQADLGVRIEQAEIRW